MSLQRRTPLKRGKPLDRGSKGLKRTEMKRGSKPIPEQSKKRKAEATDRREITRRAVASEGGRCALWFLGECNGILVAHEFAHRSVMPGAHLDEELTIPLCWSHNTAESDMTNEQAMMLGIRCSAWVVDRHGAQAARMELARIRADRAAGRVPERPFWDAL